MSSEHILIIASQLALASFIILWVMQREVNKTPPSAPLPQKWNEGATVGI
jgi:hypothetical protein